MRLQWLAAASPPRLGATKANKRVHVVARRDAMTVRQLSSESPDTTTGGGQDSAFCVGTGVDGRVGLHGGTGEMSERSRTVRRSGELRRSAGGNRPQASGHRPQAQAEAEAGAPAPTRRHWGQTPPGQTARGGAGRGGARPGSQANTCTLPPRQRVAREVVLAQTSSPRSELSSPMTSDTATKSSDTRTCLARWPPVRAMSPVTTATSPVYREAVERRTTVYAAADTGGAEAALPAFDIVPACCRNGPRASLCPIRKVSSSTNPQKEHTRAPRPRVVTWLCELRKPHSLPTTSPQDCPHRSKNAHRRIPTSGRRQACLCESLTPLASLRTIAPFPLNIPLPPSLPRMARSRPVRHFPSGTAVLDVACRSWHDKLFDGDPDALVF